MPKRQDTYSETNVCVLYYQNILCTGTLTKYFYNLIDDYGINAADFFGLFYINA